MIVVTGAAGFIGSCLVARLNELNYNDLILVDDFSNPAKAPNLLNKKYTAQVHRNEFFSWVDHNAGSIQCIIHLGARTDTTEFNTEIFDELNLNYSKTVWNLCIQHAIPLLYASSAATYGNGEHGYNDSHEVVEQLVPLNPYGDSKNDFDKWVLQQNKQPFFWAGFKFFNVYGPNEYHKGRMASVIFHAFNKIKETGAMQLFESHNPNFKNGEQMRDFVYIKDVVDVLIYFMENRKQSGLYNLGTGKAETFLELTTNTFKAMELQPNISFIPTPLDIRDKYQYFTEANMQKTRTVGYTKRFMPLSEGVADYVKNYLLPNKYW